MKYEKLLNEEMIDTIAKEMQREIDESIMLDILVNESGWVGVSYTFNNNYHAVDVKNWIEENCKSSSMRLNGSFVFEDPKDAEWFILKWL
jgi:hypothetical protein